MESFYATVSSLCFTLLGLWWTVVQFRYEAWIGDRQRMRLAYCVYFALLVPGVMSLGAQLTGDVKLIWRITFVGGGLLGTIGSAFFMPVLAGEDRPNWYMRYGRWIAAWLYLLIALVALEPTLVTNFLPGLQPLQIEGAMVTVLLALGMHFAWECMMQ